MISISLTVRLMINSLQKRWYSVITVEEDLTKILTKFTKNLALLIIHANKSKGKNSAITPIILLSNLHNPNNNSLNKEYHKIHNNLNNKPNIVKLQN